jgi:hypothetical protein
MIGFTENSIFVPLDETTSAVPGLVFENPSSDEAAESDTGKLLLTFVTLPANSCILGSYFYPAVNIRMLSGEITVLIEHWPGAGDAPVGSTTPAGGGIAHVLESGEVPTLTTDVWLQISNESFVGFANNTDAPAEFVVAGIKPDGDPGGGDCAGSCRNRP